MNQKNQKTQISQKDLTVEFTEDLYQKLLVGIKNFDFTKTEIVGIATGGVFLAQRICQDLNFKKPSILSSVLHRDDFNKRGLSRNIATSLDFEVENSNILLIDDVLYTGRTIFAVIKELYDFGRPNKINLAVLIDRNNQKNRELPIQADFSAFKIDNLENNQNLSLTQLNNEKNEKFQLTII